MKSPEIIALANQAASAATEAHSPEHLPSAEIAYEFIRNMLYEEFEGSDEEAEALWNGMAMSTQDWLLFTDAYADATNAPTDVVEEHYPASPGKATPSSFPS
jgi:hypothetical protein